MVRTGASAYIKYGKEATFGGGALETRVFGLDEKLTGITWKNNQIPIPVLNDIEIGCFAYGKNEGSMSVEFVFSNPWIFDIILDEVETTGSASDYTHNWSSKRIKIFGSGKTITSNTAASPTVVTSTAHGFSNGNVIAITGSNSSPSIDGIWTIQNVAANTFELAGSNLTGGTAGTAGTCDLARNLNIVKPHTMNIEYGHDSETSPVVRSMKGVICNSFTMKGSINETVKATAELAWGKEDVVSTTLSNAIKDDIKFPYTFAHATLKLPDTTTVAQIQEFEITFNLNSELLWGIGSADAVSAFRKIFEMTGKFKASQVDKTQLQRVIDAANGTTPATGVATLQIKLTNNLTLTNEKSIVLNFDGVGVSEHQTEAQPGEPVFEDLIWQLRSVDVEANNSIATVP